MSDAERQRVQNDEEAPPESSGAATPTDVRTTAPIKILGSMQVMVQERAHLKLAGETQAVGLALSGGGIRSASFALGVVQAFGRNRLLERFHYLSTVSGGGYLGGAIQWLRKQYGSNWFSQIDHQGRGKNEIKGADKEQFNWLDFIRHHGNYLQPGAISTLALIGTAFRGALVSVTLYFGLLVLTCLAPYALGLWCTCKVCASGAALRVLLATTTGVSLLALACNYSVATYAASLSIRSQRILGALWTLTLAAAFMLVLAALGWLPPTISTLVCTFSVNVGVDLSNEPRKILISFAMMLATLLIGNAWMLKNAFSNPDSRWHYLVRLKLQQNLGALLGVCAVIAVVCALPVVDELAGPLSISAANVLGIAGAVYQATQGRSRNGAVSGLRGELRVYVTVALLLFGFGLGAYLVAGYIYNARTDPNFGVSLAVATVVLIGLMWFTNLNLFSLGRMYRDRLMEAFMPNPSRVQQNAWGPADEADSDALSDDGAGGTGLLSNMLPAFDTHLYPLINANIILSDSPTDRFRGRGGDNFLLSPLHCGSDATGYVATTDFARGSLTLATAVAVSGAAVNPAAGSDGRGVVRNRMVSFLMFLLQARLGCWFVNPKRLTCASLFDRMVRPRAPNFIQPGLLGGLLGREAHENAQYVELTDGGHFENIAAYELVRRRCRLIVIVSGGADRNYEMEDLGNFIEKARVDFGAGFSFDPDYDLDQIRPRDDPNGGPAPFAKRGFAIARITYYDNSKGLLLYLQATPIPTVCKDVLTYQLLHPSFPNQTTANQFFDEVTVEAYRELGWEIASKAINELESAHAVDQGKRSVAAEVLDSL